MFWAMDAGLLKGALYGVDRFCPSGSRPVSYFINLMQESTAI